MAAKKKSLKKKTSAVDKAKLTQWKKKGTVLASSKSGNQWAIGDWILAGVKEFGKKKAYDEAKAATGMTRDTLYQFKFTAECFPVLTRVKGLYFGHHRLVAREEFTPDERKRLLKQAWDDGETVASFAAILRDREQTAKRRADKRSHADRAADKVVDACGALLRNHNIEVLLNQLPTYAKRNSILTTLRGTATKLNKRAEDMEKLWCEHAAADESFQRATSSGDDKKLAAGAGQ